MNFALKWLMIFFLAASCFPAQAGKVFKWTDAQGRVHFGDRPDATVEAEEIIIRTFTGLAEISVDPDEGFGSREVKILTTTWCGVCKKAKSYLASKGISFSEFDVENSEAGRQEYIRLNGKGVPIILVGNQKMFGFNAAKLNKMLQNVGFP